MSAVGILCAPGRIRGGIGIFRPLFRRQGDDPIAARPFDPFQILYDLPEVMTKFPGMILSGFPDFLGDGIVHFHSPTKIGSEDWRKGSLRSPTSSKTSQSRKIFIICNAPANNPTAGLFPALAAVGFQGSFHATIWKMEFEAPRLDSSLLPKHHLGFPGFAKPFGATGQSAYRDHPDPSAFPPNRPAGIA